MRKATVIATAGVLFLFLGACTSASTPTVTECPAPPAVDLGPSPDGGSVDLMDDIAQETTRFGQDLIGMAEDQAKQCAEDTGYVWRVFEQDGEQFMLTMDYIPTRINVAITRGVVTDAYSG